MMIKMNVFFTIILFCSCSNKVSKIETVRNPVFLLGNGSNDFSVEEKLEIKRMFFDDFAEDGKVVVINRIEYNKRKGIGLYSISTSPKSVYLENKILKFEEKIEKSSSDSIQNLLIYERFVSTYSVSFSKKQKDNIKKSFIAGPEKKGRFL